jgi:hypothetical protein
VATPPAAATDAKPDTEAAPGDDTAKKPAPAGKGVKGVKQIKQKKEKPPKMIPVTIERGILTVDGWAGKADLNYQISDFKFFYIWSPGLGTVVVSNMIFPGAKFQALAFNGNTLSITANGHQIQLASEKQLLGKKPEGAYVRLDADAPEVSRYPQVGYGASDKPPYAWPGSLADTHPNPNAPPLPPALKPTIQTTTLCTTKPDGTKTDCHTVEVPMTNGKGSKS